MAAARCRIKGVADWLASTLGAGADAVITRHGWEAGMTPQLEAMTAVIDIAAIQLIYG
jgi:hypothetical protein